MFIAIQGLFLPLFLIMTLGLAEFASFFRQFRDESDDNSGGGRGSSRTPAVGSRTAREIFRVTTRGVLRPDEYAWETREAPSAAGTLRILTTECSYMFADSGIVTSLIGGYTGDGVISRSEVIDVMP